MAFYIIPLAKWGVFSSTKLCKRLRSWIWRRAGYLFIPLLYHFFIPAAYFLIIYDFRHMGCWKTRIVYHWMYSRRFIVLP
ncbi:hypothetical protein EYC84_010967 [Monilinia fructicola]|uniref:Uncharacterized protein n=1 Tax=Monilinia fructicola TaxID=38448 RepID=A0A5M9J8V7_MONFR|nr:hypothetical protein EYC84_010967 [Monilinia fructicola]